MKTKPGFRRLFPILHSAFFILPLVAAAATSELTTALQRGLFEEEANRNLEAAITAYQSLVGQFDKDRQIAATAVFRLGEVYRKQGKTNEAIVQYERIVKEFADQQTLVTLSRQNLTGLGAGAPVRSALGDIPSLPPLSSSARAEQRRLLEEEIRLVEQHVAQQQIQADAGRMAPGELLPAKQSLLELRRKLVALADETAFAGAPATTLDGLQSQYALLKAQLEQARKETNAFMVARLLSIPLSEFSSFSGDRITEMFAYQELRLRILESAVQQAKASTAPKLVDLSLTPATDDEEQEIRRIQAMIQNSPDLINAPDNQNNTPLHRAAGKAQLAVAKFLLDHGANVNVRANQRTALHEAAQNGHKAMVELLVTRGADVNDRDAGGYTPLQIAITRKYRGVTEALLANKADVNAVRLRPGSPATPDSSPLHLATEAGEKVLVELLLANGADVHAKTSQGISDRGTTPLHRAAATGRAQIIETLLSAKADAAAQNSAGETPLHHAAASGSPEAVLALLKANPAVNAQSRLGATPLLIAASQAHTKVVSALLEQKAEPDIPGRILQHDANIPRPYVPPGEIRYALSRPIRYAVQNKNTDILKLLLENGADPEGVVEGSQQRPLFQAIEIDFAQGVELLLKFKADPNRPTAYGLAALSAAIGKPAIVKPLLDAGAKANVPNQEGRTPLNLAAEKGDKESVEALLLHQADANTADPSGNTPLLYAIPHGTELVKVLLDHGADVNRGDSTGYTPLHAAVRNGNRELIELLLSRKADVNARTKAGATPLDFAKQPSPRFNPSAALPPPPVGTPTTEAQAIAMEVERQRTMGLRPNRAAPGSPSISSPATAELSIPELLRQHGARDDLPKTDRIEVRRSSAGYSDMVFGKGTNDWNQFNVLEVISRHYEIISDQRGGVFRVRTGQQNQSLFAQSRLSFPDFKNVVVHRPSVDAKGWTPIRVNVADILSSGDCSRATVLQWGDVVEIPEVDHPVAENWPGLAELERDALVKCMARTVTIMVSGTTNRITLAPQYIQRSFNIAPVDPDARQLAPGQSRLTTASFMLRSALDQSKLIRFSSDLSRVKVTRHESGQTKEWLLDCSDSNNSPDLWLRDGDVIELPDKP